MTLCVLTKVLNFKAPGRLGSTNLFTWTAKFSKIALLAYQADKRLKMIFRTLKQRGKNK